MGDRGLAGALVRYRASGTPVQGETHSGPDGDFRLVVPSWLEALDLVIVAPGVPVHLERVHLADVGDRLPALRLQDTGGLMLVRFPDRQPLYVRHDGDPVPLWTLLLPPDRGWLRELDPAAGILHLSLSPGSYTLCPAPEARDGCAGGYLAAGGQLTVDLRGSPMPDGTLMAN